MKREDVVDTITVLFFAFVCLNVIMVFIIPGLIFRVVQDR